MAAIRANAGHDIQLISRKRFANSIHVAGVVELVDAPDSKSGSERSVGSIPTARTNNAFQLTQRSIGSSGLPRVWPDGGYLSG
jgi:hypothetical protein